MVVGLGEGAQWLLQAFLQVNEIQIEDQSYPLRSKNLKNKEVQIGVAAQLFDGGRRSGYFTINGFNERSSGYFANSWG